MPQLLTISEVVAANRKALADGTLLALHPECALVGCVYETTEGYHCSIGVALSRETLDKVRDQGLQRLKIEALLEQNIISTPDKNTADLLSILQDNHDCWLKASDDIDADAENTEEAMGIFMDTLDKLES